MTTTKGEKMPSKKALGRIWLAAIVAVTMLACSGSFALGDFSPNVPPVAEAVYAQPKPLDVAHLETVAQALASAWGDPSPTDIMAVTGLHHRQALAALMHETVETDREGIVDVAQEHGSFTAPFVSSGQPAPKGTVLTIIISRETGEITDASLTSASSAPNIATETVSIPIVLR